MTAPVQTTERGRPRGRTAIGAAIVAAVLVAGVLTVVVLRERGTATDDLERPAPERSFAWVGNAAGPFSDEQIRELATRYSTVVVARPHARANMAVQIADIARIKAAAPTVRVLLYINTSYWYDTNDTPGGWGTAYDHAWSLRDRGTGEVLRFSGQAGRPVADFIDLGNAAYRTYVLGLIRRWVQESGADGVAFDSAHPIEADLPVAGRGATTWSQLVDQPTIDAFNAGLDRLLDDARSELGPEREVLYNGIGDQPILRGRNLGLLPHADLVLDEEFCLDLDGAPNPDKLRVDLDLMADLARQDKYLLAKTNSGRVGAGAVERLGRYCSGAFLLGWQPGTSAFKYGPDYSIDELTSDPPLSGAALGDPRGPYRSQDGMLLRDFERGTVVVNPTGRDREVRVGSPSTLLAASGPSAVDTGDTVDVDGFDAVALMVGAAS